MTQHIFEWPQGGGIADCRQLYCRGKVLKSVCTCCCCVTCWHMGYARRKQLISCCGHDGRVVSAADESANRDIVIAAVQHVILADGVGPIWANCTLLTGIGPCEQMVMWQPVSIMGEGGLDTFLGGALQQLGAQQCVASHCCCCPKQAPSRCMPVCICASFMLYSELRPLCVASGVSHTHVCFA